MALIDTRKTTLSLGSKEQRHLSNLGRRMGRRGSATGQTNYLGKRILPFSGQVATFRKTYGETGPLGIASVQWIWACHFSARRRCSFWWPFDQTHQKKEQAPSAEAKGSLFSKRMWPPKAPSLKASQTLARWKPWLQELQQSQLAGAGERGFFSSRFETRTVLFLGGGGSMFFPSFSSSLFLRISPPCFWEGGGGWGELKRKGWMKETPRLSSPTLFCSSHCVAICFQCIFLAILGCWGVNCLTVLLSAGSQKPVSGTSSWVFRKIRANASRWVSFWRPFTKKGCRVEIVHRPRF